MTLTMPNWFRKAFSFPVFLGVLLIAGVFVRTQQLPIDPDTWWHVAAGERILQERALPEVDAFSFTAAGTPWIAYEWLGEVLMALAARLGGLQGRALLLLLWASLLFVL